MSLHVKKTERGDANQLDPFVPSGTIVPVELVKHQPKFRVVMRNVNRDDQVQPDENRANQEGQTSVYQGEDVVKKEDEGSEEASEEEFEEENDEKSKEESGEESGEESAEESAEESEEESQEESEEESEEGPEENQEHVKDNHKEANEEGVEDEDEDVEDEDEEDDKDQDEEEEEEEEDEEEEEEEEDEEEEEEEEDEEEEEEEEDEEDEEDEEEEVDNNIIYDTCDPKNGTCSVDCTTNGNCTNEKIDGGNYNADDSSNDTYGTEKCDCDGECNCRSMATGKTTETYMAARVIFFQHAMHTLIAEELHNIHLFRTPRKYKELVAEWIQKIEDHWTLFEQTITTPGKHKLLSCDP